MPLIQLLEVLIVVGVLLWLVNRFIPMQSSIKSILNGVVVIAVVLWLLNVFGLFHSLSRIHVGREDEVERHQSEVKTCHHEIAQHGRDLPKGEYFEDQTLFSSRNHPEYKRICSNQFSNQWPWSPWLRRPHSA